MEEAMTTRVTEECVMDYDEVAALHMLAALLGCPEARRRDTLAVVIRTYVELVDELA